MTHTWNDVDRLLPAMHTEALRAGHPYRQGTITLELPDRPGQPATLRWANTLTRDSIPGGDTLAATPDECVTIITARTNIYRDLAQAIEADMASSHRIYQFPRGAS